MGDHEQEYRIGDITIVKIPEQLLRHVAPSFLYPTAAPSEFEDVAAFLGAADLEQSGTEIPLSIHTWLVRTPDHVILVDTGSGNDKQRPLNPTFHQQSIDYIERLQAAGISPEDVDYVFNTHLHVDHAGWNTVWRDGKWVPTFPNARYVFPLAEEQYYSSPASHNEANIPSRGVYEDSVLPVIEAGLVERIAPEGGTFLDIFEFLPTTGHSIGHMSIKMSSNGETAIFAGDVMHHPAQVLRPEWNTVFCEFPDDARTARRRVLEYVADNNVLYFATHFPGSSAGRVQRKGKGFQWNYE
jgi:glyoxylase-like metal-dependent hydrolase (beta-lactamase superfamily II)